MVGDSETQKDYDEEWDTLFSSGILIDLLQKAEQENAAKRTSQAVPSFPNEQSELPSLVGDMPCASPPNNTPTSTVLPASSLNVALSAASNFSNLQTNLNRPPILGEHLEIRPAVIQSVSFKRPPLPNELKESQRASTFELNAFGPSQSLISHTGPLNLGSTFKGNANTRIQLTNGATRLLREGDQNTNELLAEKDGAIALLRSRLAQADSELYELRRHSGTSSQQVPHPEQRELERFAAELSFKDQEVLEAKIARDENKERLKEALETAERLKEELDSFKRFSQLHTAGNKRCHEEAEAEVKGNTVQQPRDGAHNEANGLGLKGSLQGFRAQEKMQARGLQPGQEMWTAPWELGQLLTSRPTEKQVILNKIVAPRELSDMAVLKARTLEDDCVTSSQQEKLALQATDLSVREPTMKANATSDPCIQPVRPARGFGPENATGMRELTHPLQQIWNFKGARDDGIALVSEIFAVCRHDLYVLSTHDGSLEEANRKELGSKTSSSKRIPGPKRKDSNDKLKKDLGEGISLNLHNAIANVVNKLAPSTTLVGPLLEYCNLDNVDKAQSALHILRCILRHDFSCREKVLAGLTLVEFNLNATESTSEILNRLNTKHEGKGWCISYSGSQSKGKHSVPVFSSPRIVARPLDIHKETAPRTLAREQPEQQPDGTGVQLEVPSPGNKVQHEKGTRSLSPFVKWLLDLSMRSLSSAVRFEAIAIIGLLVMHSEPSVDRAQFASLLWDGGLAPLLKESAGVGVQLQAVRVVHLLLHCPVLLQTFCDGKEISNDSCKRSARPAEETTEEKTAFDTQLELHGKGRHGPLMEGLASCLRYTGNSLPEYALRRNAVRVLTFLAASGESGTATLMQVHLSQYATEQTRPSKEADNTCEDGNCPPGNPCEGSAGLLAKVGSAVWVNENSSFGERIEKEKMVVKDGKKGCSIPWWLVSLLALELNVEEDEATSHSDKTVSAEDRCNSNSTISFRSEGQWYTQLPGLVLLKLVPDSDNIRATIYLYSSSQTQIFHTIAGPYLSFSADNLHPIKQAGPVREEQWACLIREVLTLLCKLSLHANHSHAVLALLTVDKETTRLALGAMNQLISGGPWGPSADLIELARGLQKRILMELPGYQESSQQTCP